MNTKISNMLLKSEVNESFSITIKEVYFYNIKELQSLYETKQIMNIGGYMIDVYSHENNNYLVDRINEISKLGKLLCVIEESPKGIKIHSIDSKYQIPFMIIKDIKQVRLDHFDYGEGLIEYIPVNDLDNNDKAYIEQTEMYNFVDKLNLIKDNHGGYIGGCEFELMQCILEQYDKWCLDGHREYPMMSLGFIDMIKPNFQIYVACLIYVSSIGNGGYDSLNHYFNSAYNRAREIGIIEHKNEIDIDITLSSITKIIN